IMFDGSAMDGSARVEESDMLLRPDPSSLRFVQEEDGTGTASVACDVYRPDGAPFEGDPRSALRRAIAGVEALGFEPHVGADLEFFLFRLDAEGNPSLELHDRGGYYELGPLDEGGQA